MFSSLWAKSTVTLLLVALIIVGSCRMMKMAGCSARKPRPPRPARIDTVGPYAVVRVDSGASLMLQTGSNRRPRETQAMLRYCEASVMAEWAKVAADHLREIAGEKVTIQVERHGLREEAETGPELEEAEARGPLLGVCIGASGINLNRAQLEGGYVKASADAPKEYKAAEAEAQKAKRGVWSR